MRLSPMLLVACSVFALTACGKSSIKAPPQNAQEGTAAVPRTGEPQKDTTQQMADLNSASTVAAPSAGSVLTMAQPNVPVISTADIFSPDKLHAALQAIGAKPAPRGQVINDCGDAVTPTIKPADLGGDIGRAWLVVIGGGPSMAACYGDTGMAIYLLKTEAHGFKLIFSGQGNLAVLPTDHKGVKDIAVAGPGFDFPVYAWTGSAYEHARSIKDSELPATLN